MADRPPLRLRTATAADVDALAALHARSWRTAYRGSFSDAYLDGPVDEERRGFWRERYAHPRAGLWTVLAEDEGGHLRGFLCLLPDHDRQWGTLIDNLHADPDSKRAGVGRVLMGAAADHLLHGLPRRPVHLFVLAGNAAAIGFYGRLGGEPVERLVKEEPDGSHHAVLRYAWPGPAALAEGAGR